MRKLQAVVCTSILAGLLISACAPTEEAPVAGKQPAPEPAPGEPAAAAEAPEPTNDIRPDGLVPDWLVMVFALKPGGERTQDEEYFLSTFKKDYLGPIGGEAKAVLTDETKVAYKNEAGEDQTATSEAASVEASGWLSSEWDPELAGRKITYAFCYLRSDKPQEVKCYFGSDDEAKVWVNNKLAHETYEQRSCAARDDSFTVQLKKGLNPVLVKTSQRTVSWVFVLEVYAEEE